MIGEILYIVSLFLAGFITGALVARNNLDEVNKAVEEAKELAEKAEAELKKYRDAAEAKKKPPVKRKATRKKPVKKPQVD